MYAIKAKICRKVQNLCRAGSETKLGRKILSVMILKKKLVLNKIPLSKVSENLPMVSKSAHSPNSKIRVECLFQIKKIQLHYQSV
jgi:CII-binding regulator of phage lambda lysogenization HflD